MLLEKRPFVSIISVNYNQLALTCEMLNSLRQQNYDHYEVILVDNASKEDPSTYIHEKYPEVKLIVSKENLGFAGGNNLGVKASKGDYLFFINNDTELTADLIEGLLRSFEEVDNLGCVSPLICYFPESESEAEEIIQYAGTTPLNPYTARNATIGNGAVNHGQYSQLTPTPYAHGAAMMLPRKVIEKVGMLSEAFFLYYEELDWCEQIRKAGFSIYVDPRVKIYHKESAAVGPQSPLKTYYINRNRILFMRRNQPTPQLLVFALFFAAVTFPRWILTFVLRGQWQHLRVFIKAVVWNLRHQSKESDKLEKTLFPSTLKKSQSI